MGTGITTITVIVVVVIIIIIQLAAGSPVSSRPGVQAEQRLVHDRAGRAGCWDGRPSSHTSGLCERGQVAKPLQLQYLHL